ncbi:MAG: hypothetical protein DMF49_02810 [Acidobacteria bacterium]|nr:MAG: hypothetical protein DMF49_02810 [Acidobacteriota bacterium]
MARPKSITIKLTETQRTQLRKLTGQDHKSVRFDAVTSRSGRSALGRIAAPSIVGAETSTTVGAAQDFAGSHGMDPTTLGGKSALSGKTIAITGTLVPSTGHGTMDPTK